MDDGTKILPGYRWIIVDRELLGGQPAIRGTRLSVAHVLACLAEGMSGTEIAIDYPGFPPESIPEVLRFASEELEQRRSTDVAA
jgi:uncharacterized protein (DUF433 family)